jgi:hypothetical protein
MSVARAPKLALPPKHAPVSAPWSGLGPMPTLMQHICLIHVYPSSFAASSVQVRRSPLVLSQSHTWVSPSPGTLRGYDTTPRELSSRQQYHHKRAKWQVLATSSIYSCSCILLCRDIGCVWLSGPAWAWLSERTRLKGARMCRANKQCLVVWSKWTRLIWYIVWFLFL